MKKAVALLELKSGAVDSDTNVLKTISYYWCKNNIFNNFSIVNTTSSSILTSEDIKNQTLNLLNEYYNKGYRIFLGFSRSTLLDSILQWFDNHPMAIGISLSSSSTSLSKPKNIYRLQPTDEKCIKSINDILQTSNYIYYVYSIDELASNEVFDYLKNTYGESKIKPFAVNSNGSNLTTVNLSNFFVNYQPEDNVIVYLFIGDQRQKYVNLFNNFDGLNISMNQYDIVLSGIPTINSSNTTLNGFYNLLLQNSMTRSYLYDDGSQYLENSFSSQALNGLEIITTLINNDDISKINSYNGVLEFDVNRDLIYSSFQIVSYTINNQFENNNIITEDPLYGKLTFKKI